ncbi:MAG: ABC transporter ATP-binding protein [Planctomyces sp.]
MSNDFWQIGSSSPNPQTGIRAEVFQRDDEVMAKRAVIVENLRKTYRLTTGPQVNRLSELFADAWYRLTHRSSDSRTSQHKDYHALDGISFSVAAGESLAILGANGAGKSTLLKILTGITEPTAGRSGVRGRIGSLLEVGTGFHPELTGRENIFLNGAILGMSRAEIRQRFDAIVEFADISEFLDMPVKRYSSGMYMRLGFAIASQMEPDILIVDEVLAVGDQKFQKKCLDKLSSLIREGRTVLFVSHNLTAVRSLCHRAIWIEHGRLRMDGPAGQVVDAYLGAGSDASAVRTWENPETAPGNESVRVRRIAVQPVSGQTISTATPVEMHFEVWNFLTSAKLHFGLILCTSDDFIILNDHSAQVTAGPGMLSGRCLIPGNLLNDGTFSVRLMVIKDGTDCVLDLHRLVQFDVNDVERPDSGWFGKWPGVVRPHFQWETAHAPF